MTLTDLDFPVYKSFKKTCPFVLTISKINEEIIKELSKPLIRVQFKLSSKRKQVMFGTDTENEINISPEIKNSELINNLSLRSMASQIGKEKISKNKFIDEEPINDNNFNFNINISGLQNLLKFRKNKFESMHLDPLNLTTREIEKIEEKDLFQGNTRSIKEELFLPIKQNSKEIIVWDENEGHNKRIINKKNQKIILNELEKTFGNQMKIKSFELVDLITYVENIFLQNHQSQASPKIVFDFDLD